jgi:phage recombination protein Bet
MSNELATRTQAQIVHAQEWMGDKASLAIVRRDLAPGLDDQEFQVYLGVCRATGLNPILRQIYAIKRKDAKAPSGHRVTYQMGIDGLRLQADRSRAYAGSDDPEFSYRENVKFPITATCTVWKVVGGVRCPFTATARWSEYCPSRSEDAFMWNSKPCVMLGKCAEALALRKAFPAETSGFYIPEELQASETLDVEAEAVSIAMPKRKSEQAPPAQSEPSPQADIAAEVAEQDRREKELADAQYQQTDLDWSGNWTKGVIENTSVKTGGSGDKSWKLTGGKCSDGHWYNTFSETVGSRLVEACQRGAAVFVKWEPNKKYADKRDALEVRFP